MRCEGGRKEEEEEAEAEAEAERKEGRTDERTHTESVNKTIPRFREWPAEMFRQVPTGTSRLFPRTGYKTLLRDSADADVAARHGVYEV